MALGLFTKADEEKEVRTANPRKRLEGKTAVVTGAGSGIGRAAAIRMAEEGARVCLVDLKENDSGEVRRTIAAAGGEAIVTDTDVSDAERVEAAIRDAVGAFGRLDIVFANAGINGTMAPIETMKPEEWSHTLTTNLNGTFYIVKYAIPHLKENGGSVIITSSINGNRKFKNFGGAAYSASKAAQVAFAKMAALELAQFGIRVNAICPGGIETNIGENTQRTDAVDEIEIPIKYPKGSQPLEHRSGTPEQVADLVLFLASNESRHITGTEVYIDGAESLL